MNSTEWIPKLAMGLVLAAGAAPVNALEANEGTPGVTPGAITPTIQYQSVKEQVHFVRIDGSSNLVDWHVTGNSVSGAIEIPAVWAREGEVLRLKPNLTAATAGYNARAWIPVLKITGEKEGLSKKMHESLNAYKHRYVTFALNEVKAASPGSAQGGARWEVRGELTVSGATREVDLTANLIPQEGDRIQVEIKKELKMTDFEIKPPTALGGFVSATDEVEVEIKWVLERQTPQPTMPRAALSEARRQAVSGIIDAYTEIRLALQESASGKIESSLEKARNLLDPLEGAESEGLEEALTALRKALRRMDSAASAEEMRAAFAEISGALKEVVAIGGHSHNANVAVYRHSNREDVTGAEWLQVQNPKEEASSPYSEGEVTAVHEVVAIYPVQGAGESSVER